MCAHAPTHCRALSAASCQLSAVCAFPLAQGSRGRQAPRPGIWNSFISGSRRPGTSRISCLPPPPACSTAPPMTCWAAPPTSGWGLAKGPLSSTCAKGTCRGSHLGKVPGLPPGLCVGKSHRSGEAVRANPNLNCVGAGHRGQCDRHLLADVFARLTPCAAGDSLNLQLPRTIGTCAAKHNLHFCFGQGQPDPPRLTPLPEWPSPPLCRPFCQPSK